MDDEQLRLKAIGTREALVLTRLDKLTQFISGFGISPQIVISGSNNDIAARNAKPVAERDNLRMPIRRVSGCLPQPMSPVNASISTGGCSRSMSGNRCWKSAGIAVRQLLREQDAYGFVFHFPTRSPASRSE